jgi:hypothetical protein
MLMVQPFDQSTMKAVEKGIQASGLGLNPASQGRFIRIVLPDLSSERRQEFVKICKRIAEEGRVAVRNERRQAIEALKKTKNDGGVSEDAIKTAEADVQKLTDSFIAKVDQHLTIKEKEFLRVPIGGSKEMAVSIRSQTLGLSNFNQEPEETVEYPRRLMQWPKVWEERLDLSMSTQLKDSSFMEKISKVSYGIPTFCRSLEIAFLQWRVSPCQMGSSGFSQEGRNTLILQAPPVFAMQLLL